MAPDACPMPDTSIRAARYVITQVRRPDMWSLAFTSIRHAEDVRTGANRDRYARPRIAASYRGTPVSRRLLHAPQRTWKARLRSNQVRKSCRLRGSVSRWPRWRRCHRGRHGPSSLARGLLSCGMRLPVTRWTAWRTRLCTRYVPLLTVAEFCVPYPDPGEAATDLAPREARRDPVRAYCDALFA